MRIENSDVAKSDRPEPCRLRMDADFGRRLRTARGWHGWTPDDLALQTGVTPGEIERLEAAKKPIAGADVLVALADAVGVSLEWLTCGKVAAKDATKIIAALEDNFEAICAVLANPKRH